ncbi:cytochrome c family protein [Desulfovibrio sp. JY]|nr:cytochrome c family protein [Desulfovibrio sp. JY]
MGWRFLVGLAAAGLLTLCPGVGSGGQQAPPVRYVGSKACSGCHSAQYEAFMKHSKKAHSTVSLRRMAGKLTPEELTGCFACHTTGYGKPGGFTSFAATPGMAEAGCEVCHGPGSAHVASQDPADIKGKLTVADCQGCHNATRVRAFGYKPLLQAGAH